MFTCDTYTRAPINIHVNEYGPQLTLGAKVAWIHVQKMALTSALYLEVLWDIRSGR